MIDLRSDTVTIPTADMRKAMSEADVGDDVYGDDPTVRDLEIKTAELLGKEAAVYLPTGTMSNQVALRTHTEPGDEILTDIGAHIYINEGGGPASLSGLVVRPIFTENGIFSAEQLTKALRELHRFNPSTIASPTTLICLENTHNSGGGTIWPLDTMQEVSEVARNKSIKLHLDGARLWNATAATDITESKYASYFDSVSVCFSKGLGAPIGSALAGSAPFIQRARRFKQMFGGGFRQAGIVAAAALYALMHHRTGLGNDHAKAKSLAIGLAKLPNISLEPKRVQTNIIRLGLQELSSFELAESCYKRGVHILPSGKTAIRLVVHRNIKSTDIETTLRVFKEVLEEKS